MLVCFVIPVVNHYILYFSRCTARRPLMASAYTVAADRVQVCSGSDMSPAMAVLVCLFAVCCPPGSPPLCLKRSPVQLKT